MLDAVLASTVNVEVVLVDDGSTDGTWRIMQDRAKANPRVRAYRHEVNGGKEAAIRTALKHARGSVVLIQDADLKYDPSEDPALLAPIESGRATIVYGSRAFSSHTAFSYWYVMGNRLVTLATNVIYNCYLSDRGTCYRVMPRSVALSLNLRARGFELEPEITAKLLRSGHWIYEVPITYTARTRAEGKRLTARDGIRALRTLARYRS
jgi:glycosyltransferase involved in cell wall biosynthesis